MAKVLVTTLAWLYSLAAVFHAILAPVLLQLIASFQVFRLILLTYIFQIALLPTFVYFWYKNYVPPPNPKRRKSVTTAEPDADEATALLPEASSREFGSLRNRRSSPSSSAEAEEVSAPPGTASIDLRTFLKQRKVQVSLLALATIINTVLFGFCVDFVFKPFYFEKNYDLLVTRVGGVKSDSVKIFVRSPQVTQIHLEYRPTGSSSSSWNTCGAPAAVGPETDYTLSAECIGLSPSTRYEYRWISERDGQPLFSSQEMADMHFNTTPKINAPSKFNFAFTSCVKPGFPYGTKGLKGFREMGKQDLSFVLFLGDLIYADAPYLYGTDVDTYRWHYRYLYSQKDFSQTFSRIPLMSIYDDHEVLNNWEWETQQPYPAAFQAFNEYAGLTNPHHDANQTAVFDWSYGDVAFFVMDTREFRSFENQTMLGIEQKQRLKNWLLQVNATSSIKFLVSSVPFTQNWQWEHRDTWAGYLKERQEILDFIAENHIQNVMVISGDRHEVAITRLPGNVIEFSTSPLQAFYSPIDTYVETGDDEKIFTWRPGNVKWAMFSINTQAENPSAKYSLFVNDYQDSPIYEREFLLNPLR